MTGERLPVLGKARLRIHAGGHTSNLEAWVVEGIRPHLILGLPWVQQEQPQVDWHNAAALVFADGSRWRTGHLGDSSPEEEEMDVYDVDAIEVMKEGRR